MEPESIFACVLASLLFSPLYEVALAVLKKFVWLFVLNMRQSPKSSVLTKSLPLVALQYIVK